MYSIKILIGILNFDVFWDWWYAIRYSLIMVGSGSEAQLPVNYTITMVNNWYSTVYLVLDDFALL